MKRVFMVGNLDNFYGDLNRLHEAIGVAEPFETVLAGGRLTEENVGDVASAFAEAVWHDWDCPSNFDLLIWEVMGASKRSESAPATVFRVGINVEFTPEFWDTNESTLQVPTPEAAS